MEEIAEEVGWGRNTIWCWRKKPEFQAEYLRQLRAVEQQAFDYGISRRVERIAALNEQWLKLRKAMDRGQPRADHTYQLIALQTAAAKELGQDVTRVEGRLEIEQAVRVIHFTEQEPRADLPDAAVDADFTERRVIRDPVPVAALPEPAFDPDLAQVGVSRRGPGRLDPEQAAAIKRAIADAGLDPAAVLVPEQFKAIYGEEE